LISLRSSSFFYRESLTVGVLLNTKGLVELIVLNIGLDVGILTEEMFASFIVMALFNTFITTPLCYLLWTRWAVRTDPNLRPKYVATKPDHRTHRTHRTAHA
jgi:Kef-type K+ transport system membrane component KefB